MAPIKESEIFKGAASFGRRKFLWGSLLLAGGALFVERGASGIKNVGEQSKKLAEATHPLKNDKKTIDKAVADVLVYESTARELGASGRINELPNQFDSKAIADAYEIGNDGLRAQFNRDKLATDFMAQEGTTPILIFFGGVIATFFGLAVTASAITDKLLKWFIKKDKTDLSPKIETTV